LIKYQGTKVVVSVSGEAMGINVDVKNISKEIQELTSATEYAKILDDFQYLLCKEVANSQDDPKYANKLRRYRILIVSHIASIALIMKQIQDGLLTGLKDEIIKISESMRSLIAKLEKSFLEL
jgi:hypothetical protein